MKSTVQINTRRDVGIMIYNLSSFSQYLRLPSNSHGVVMVDGPSLV